MLNCFRRRRLRNRLSLLAIVALLWSQMVLAGHAGCFAMSMPPMVAAAAAAHHHCGEQVDQADLGVCEAHCNQGDSGPATPPAHLSVPALPPDSFAIIAVLLQIDSDVVERAPARATAAWHRPTLHPASVLLI
jgi:hypothetical protein